MREERREKREERREKREERREKRKDEMFPCVFMFLLPRIRAEQI